MNLRLVDKLLRAVLMAVILAVALSLRLWGNMVGLPDNYVPDEEAKVRTILTLPEHGFSHWTSQPSFLYNSLFLVYTALDPWKERIMDAPRFELRFIGPQAESAWYRWVGRCYMAVLGTLTCFFIYRLGKEFRNRAAGFFGAAIHAVAPLPIALTHYLKEDTPLALFLVIAALFSLRLLRRGRQKDYVLAGITAGAAFASKYPGVVALLFVAGAVYIRNRDSITHSGNLAAGLRRFWARFWRPLAAFAVTFFVICPSYLNVVRLVEGLYFQSGYMLEGHHDGIRVWPWNNWFSFHLRKSVIPAVSLPVVLAAIAGAWLLYKEQRHRAIIPVAFAVGYLLVAEILPSKPYPFYSRYIIPVIPFVCLFCGYLAARIPVLIGESLVPAMRIALHTTSVLLFVVTPFYLSIQFLFEIEPDTRDVARAWVWQNLPKDSVLLIPTPRYSVSLRPEDFTQFRLDRRTWNLRRAQYQLEGRPVFAIISTFDYERYTENPGQSRTESELYGPLMEDNRLLAEFAPRFRSYGYHNPTVRVYMLGAADREYLEQALKIRTGELEDEHVGRDTIEPFPPFPERLSHD